MEDGLPQSSVNAIAQDSSGYIWIGTFGGLARFDGVRFVPTPLRSHQKAAAGTRILRLLHARDGKLWIGTQIGVVLTRWQGDLHLAGDFSPQGSAAILEGEDGAIWFATCRRIYRWRNGTLEPYSQPLQKSIGNIFSILPEPGGTLLAGTDSGLFRVSATGVERLPEVTPGVPVRCLARTRNGEVLLGTLEGLIRLDPPGGTTRLAQGFNVGHVLEDRDGSIWIGTFRKGLWRYSNGRLEHCTGRAGLETGRITSLFEDNEGDIWAGTARSGLHELVAGPVVPFGGSGSPLDRSVTAVTGSQDGVWAGLGCDGIASIRGDTTTVFPVQGPSGTSNLCIQSILPDPDGGLLLGAWVPFLYRFEAGRISVLARLPGGIGVTRAMLPLDDGRLLLGTGSGLVWLDRGQVRTVEATAGVAVYCILRCGDGRILAGTDRGVLELEDGNTVRNLVGTEALWGEAVRAMLEEEEGGLWIGTYGSGLFLQKDGRLFPLSDAAALPGRIVSAIVEDRFGNLWLTGNDGVTRVARSDLLALVRGGTGPIPHRLFTARDGLPATECNGGGRLPAWLAPDEALWVPTMRGLARIDTRPVPSTREPRPLIEGALLDGRPISLSKLTTLPATASNLEIQYTAIWFQSPLDLMFRYRLEGSDDHWQEAGTRRTAYYPRIPPGELRFHLQAKVGANPWIEVPGGVRIRRTSRLTESAAFPVLAALLSAGIVATLLLLRLRTERRRQRQLEEAVRQSNIERDQLAGLLARINEGQSLPELLDFLYEAIRDLLPCDRIGYSVIEGELVRSAWARSSSEPIRLGVGLNAPLASTSLDALARDGTMRIIGDLEEHLRRRPQSEPTRLLVEEGMRSSLSVPLHAFGKPVGFLFFNSVRRHAYTEAHARLLQTIGSQLSVIIEKSRLMTELGEANAILAEQATTDPLTGLANRRAFEKHLELEWMRMRRFGQPLAVLFCDLDHFKAYNDLYGHAQGDTCLKDVATTLARFAQRPGDLAARWGGEEFVIVLSSTPLEGALAIAERIRRAIEEAAILHEASPISRVVTATIGVAVRIPGEAEPPEDLLVAADEALYRAKRAGRNRVLAHQQSASST